MEFLDYLTIKLAGVSTWKRDRDMLILFVLILILRNYEVFPFIPLVLFKQNIYNHKHNSEKPTNDPTSLISDQMNV